MQEKRVEFINSKGNKLVGYYYKSNSKSIIISCHGTHSYSAFPQVKSIFDYYHKLGFSVLRFDFTGYGESEGKISLLQRIDDIGSVINQFGHDYKEIIISAISLGTLTAAIAAAKYKQVTKLIVTNGVFNFEEIHFFLKLQLWIYLLTHPYLIKEIKETTAMLNPKKITVPTLVVYYQNDTVVSPKQSVRFFDELRTDKTLRVIKNANHYSFDKKTIDASNAVVADWLKTYHLPR